MNENIRVMVVHKRGAHKLHVDVDDVAPARIVRVRIKEFDKGFLSEYTTQAEGCPGRNGKGKSTIVIPSNLGIKEGDIVAIRILPVADGGLREWFEDDKSKGFKGGSE